MTAPKITMIAVSARLRIRGAPPQYLAKIFTSSSRFAGGGGHRCGPLVTICTVAPR